MRHLYPEDISALLLFELKQQAQKFLGIENIQDVVITVPAYFNDKQREATMKAASLVGLNCIRLINEPTAAALSYAIIKNFDSRRLVLVFDLGGGTFDVSIVKVVS